ncbi:uncharacterized protein ACOB8E_019160 [Sarcophilus harrisii]
MEGRPPYPEPGWSPPGHWCLFQAFRTEASTKLWLQWAEVPSGGGGGKGAEAGAPCPGISLGSPPPGVRRVSVPPQGLRASPQDLGVSLYAIPGISTGVCGLHRLRASLRAFGSHWMCGAQGSAPRPSVNRQQEDCAMRKRTSLGEGKGARAILGALGAGTVRLSWGRRRPALRVRDARRRPLRGSHVTGTAAGVGRGRATWQRAGPRTALPLAPSAAPARIHRISARAPGCGSQEDPLGTWGRPAGALPRPCPPPGAQPPPPTGPNQSLRLRGRRCGRRAGRQEGAPAPPLSPSPSSCSLRPVSPMRARARAISLEGGRAWGGGCRGRAQHPSPHGSPGGGAWGRGAALSIPPPHGSSEAGRGGRGAALSIPPPPQLFRSGPGGGGGADLSIPPHGSPGGGAGEGSRAQHPPPHGSPEAGRGGRGSRSQRPPPPTALRGGARGRGAALSITPPPHGSPEAGGGEGEPRSASPPHGPPEASGPAPRQPSLAARTRSGSVSSRIRRRDCPSRLLPCRCSGPAPSSHPLAGLGGTGPALPSGPPLIPG